jgi:ribosomal protein S18 acetylase RimI-like enzyme
MIGSPMRIDQIRFLDDDVVTEDLMDVYAVMRAHEEEVDPDDPEVSVDAARADLLAPQTFRDRCLIVREGSKPLAAVITSVDRTSRDIYLDIYSVPGEGDELLDSLVASSVNFAREIAGADKNSLRAWDVDEPLAPHSGIWQVTAFNVSSDDRYSAALAKHGLTVARRYWKMQILFDGPVTAPSPMPGLELIRATTEDLLRELHASTEASFDEHYGFTARRFEEWLENFTAHAGYDPERNWCVRLDGVPAGVLVCDNSRKDEGFDYLRTLGVREEFRGKGIATWLLRYSFAEAAAQGWRGMELGVDSDNSTGAVALYERVGMRPVKVYLAHKVVVS